MGEPRIPGSRPARQTPRDTSRIRRGQAFQQDAVDGRLQTGGRIDRVEIHRTSNAADPSIDRAVLSDAARGLQTLRRAGDDVWEARLLYNRGALYFDRGDLDRAESDFRRALEIQTRHGAEFVVADYTLALAEVALLRGDVVTSLKAIEDARDVLPPSPLSNLGRLLVLALTQARLLPEARTAGEEYVTLCSRTGRADYVAAGLLESGLRRSGSGWSRPFAVPPARDS